MRLLGAVLAGGRSSRFGSDKALALLDGKPLIEHAIDALAAQTDAVIVCGKAWGDWVPDRPEPDLGPLGGINAALHAAAARDYDAVLTVPCDVPGLPGTLAKSLGEGAIVADMPVIGLWRVALAERLEAWLRGAGNRSVRGWARAAGVPEVRLDAPLANINRPVDLRGITCP